MGMQVKAGAKRRRTVPPKGAKDGPAMCHFLMSIFFTRDTLCNGTLGQPDAGSSLQALDPQIVGAILGN